MLKNKHLWHALHPSRAMETLSSELASDCSTLSKERCKKPRSPEELFKHQASSSPIKLNDTTYNATIEHYSRTRNWTCKHSHWNTLEQIGFWVVLKHYTERLHLFWVQDGNRTSGTRNWSCASCGMSGGNSTSRFGSGSTRIVEACPDRVPNGQAMSCMNGNHFFFSSLISCSRYLRKSLELYISSSKICSGLIWAWIGLIWSRILMIYDIKCWIHSFVIAKVSSHVLRPGKKHRRQTTMRWDLGFRQWMGNGSFQKTPATVEIKVFFFPLDLRSPESLMIFAYFLVLTFWGPEFVAAMCMAGIPISRSIDVGP